MRHMSHAGAGHGSAIDLHSWHGRVVLDALLSSAMVLAVSAFTVAAIVMIVTSVNSHIGPVDLWSRWMSPPVVDMSQSAPTEAELAVWIETTQQAETQSDALPTPGQ